MKPFHIMRVFNVRFNKLSALLDALVLVFVGSRSMLVTLPDTGSYIVGDQFYQGIRGTIRQGFVRFGNSRFDFTCRLQPGKGCTFASSMDLDEGRKELYFLPHRRFSCLWR